MRDIIRRQVEAIREEPVERLMKPSIKAVVLISVLSTAALYFSERYDRKGLARLAAETPAAQKASVRRP